MKTSDIRKAFLDFFASKGHTIVPSSSLVPQGDPTLLFTNAGMNQFKNVFLGLEERSYKRATTAQKCVRAGGKHNDLENVGYTARHHTFFEMLGNFSFGDYFKREAIAYAWELLTEVFKLPPERLWVTVYAEDDEAYRIWAEGIGVPRERIVRIGDNKGARYASDNFWMMGDTGPCGPCTEIFYDHGPEVPGGPPGSPDEDGDRYIEIWNLVFMQYNRDDKGEMHPLPKPSVDTGMGLERIAAVLQGVHSNYEIDLFQRLIAAAMELTGCTDRDQPSLKVLADHIRAASFLIADGVIPGNEGRGYVLRRIIRRAIRHGWKLGVRAPFFHRLVPALVAEMGEAYPELVARQSVIEATLRQEEERFFGTIEHGMSLLETVIAQMQANGQGELDGEIAFKLHDTYGFPLDLTADVLRERGFTVDVAGFDAAMARQKAMARAAGKFKMQAVLEYEGPTTRFEGYETLEDEGEIVALYRDGAPVEELAEGEEGVVVLDRTPFYAESGGQAGDRGELRAPEGIFSVEDTQKIQAEVFGHYGVVRTGRLALGQRVRARVDAEARAATARHHSATHLLHKALREVLGSHVEQKGSLVDADRLRFDFAHHQPLTQEEIERIEWLVNREVLANVPTRAEVMPLEAAKASGAVMLFGEKYGETVRVLTIGSSKELCGGTHVARTGDIGLVKIVAESAIAAGVRRIEAVAGEVALRWVQGVDRTLERLAQTLKVAREEVPARVEALLEQTREAARERARLVQRLAQAEAAALAAAAETAGEAKLLVRRVEADSPEALRELADALRSRLPKAAVLLGTVIEGKAVVLAAVSKELSARLKAGDWVKAAAEAMGARGGGRPELAQAGGGDPAKLDEALGQGKAWAQERLQG
ncbi:alanine--tRNA ligase [Tepidiphilus baoligensis]|uniref:Alanine--tRNA ligase n=1 Tax=Tepidiphilus baoligensis TaxID=2698687 RepID=A0ABX1QK88_9PROT|nr:alanine--tRNA ligase [Tepidiphilus baoligensis]NMH16356.1 alanine--tRNA ligase [Tepidiphilus baoligensis]